jgi:cleavage and polyadenylation specificity factor subunit 1
MDSGLSSIIWCSIADPYVILMTADGSVVFLEFTKDSNGPKLTVSRPPVNQVCSLFY